MTGSAAPAAILFDQYSRYRACADILNALLPSGSTVLDCGSGKDCLLGRFLPDFDITYVDPLLARRKDRTDRMLAGDVFQRALDGKRFDFVVSVDTLEHVPPTRRAAFLERISGLAREGIIIACPCADAGEATATDHYVNEVYAATCGHDYPFLREHCVFGLPLLGDLVRQLTQGGWHIVQLENGHAPRLRVLLAFVLCALESPWMRRSALLLSEQFNRDLQAFDYEPPGYRQIVVATASCREDLQIATPLTPEMTAEAARGWQHLEEQIESLWDGTWKTRISWSVARCLIRLRWLIQKSLVDLASWLQWTVARLPLFARARWPLRRAFFATVGRLCRGTPPYENYRRELEWRRRRPAALPAGKALDRPSDRDRPDIFLWDAVATPQGSDRLAGLARGFAANGHHVFHITAPFVNSPEPGFESVREDPEFPIHHMRLHRNEAPIAGRLDEQLLASVGRLLAWSGSVQIVSIVADPFWMYVAERLPNSRLVYDGTAILPTESKPMRHVDLLIGATEEACARIGEISPDVVLVSEACETTGWSRRARELLEALARHAEPLVSLVIVTYNRRELTRACLESIEHESDYPALDVVVVDNASTDGTPAFLRHWAEKRAWARIVLNETNRGFPTATNQGLGMASGEYLVVLNNDIVVTRGWVRTLINHLRADPSIGIIGPVTNSIGNEARVPTAYRTRAEMPAEASALTLRALGRTFEMRTLAFFCVMIPRPVYERAGPLDEEFGIGFFEDDDYCRRIEQLGYRIICAEDVFVHHEMSASFEGLPPWRQRAIFEASRRRYESKWGTWTPHGHRADGGI